VQDGPTIFQGVQWSSNSSIEVLLESGGLGLEPDGADASGRGHLTSHSDLFKDGSVLKTVGTLIFEVQEHAQHDILANFYSVVRLDQVNSSSTTLLK
jgi:hypothetical protein